MVEKNMFGLFFEEKHIFQKIFQKNLQKIVQCSKTSKNGVLARRRRKFFGIMFATNPPLFRNTRKQGGFVARNSIDSFLSPATLRAKSGGIGKRREAPKVQKTSGKGGKSA